MMAMARREVMGMSWRVANMGVKRILSVLTLSFLGVLRHFLGAKFMYTLGRSQVCSLI
jgi:hypothetical protein